MQAARVAAIVLCLAVSSALGTWYLCVLIPEKEWSASYEAGRESLDLGRFNEAERHFLAAVEAARAFGAVDRRLAQSQFLLAQALVGQCRQTEALRLLERSIAIYDKVLGPNHADSARVRLYYASHHGAIGSTEEPQPLPEQIR